MPYNEELDQAVSGVIAGWETTRKKMFGGTCHLINGNMMCGVLRDDLILRLGEDQAREAMAQTSARPFDITGKPMRGWVMINWKELDPLTMKAWLEKARNFAGQLPAKLKK